MTKLKQRAISVDFLKQKIFKKFSQFTLKLFFKST